MSFSPNPINFTYRKQSGTVPNTTLEFFPPDGWTIHQLPTVQSKPAWLNLILNETIRDEENKIIKLIYKLAVVPQYADTLSEGLHTGKVTTKCRIRISLGLADYTTSFDVNIRVIEDLQLAISRTYYTFSHTIGDVAPAAQFLTITTSRAWSIASNQTWLLFSQSNGDATSTISLSVDVANLPTGLYTANYIVDDGAAQKTGSVNLVIRGTDNVEDFLNVSPTVLEISENYQEEPTSERVIRIDSSLPVDISSNVAWLQLSAIEFPSGLNNLTLNAIDTGVLQVGVYPAQISITSTYGTSIVNVVLRIIANITSGIESGGFYFAEDRNSLFLTNANQNAEAILDFVTRATLEVKFYKRRIPFFRNAASVIIGQETTKLLQPQALPEFLITNVHIPVRPIRYDFTVYDKSMNTAAMIERQKFENILFMNGRTPKVTNRLTYVPARLTVPADGVIAFSFISQEPPASIEISGAVTTSIPLGAEENNVYSVFIKLTDLNLSSSDKINISAGPITLEVTIKPSELLTTQLIWLNEWDCPEVFNFDGTVEMIPEDESTTVTINRDGRDYSSIIDTKEPWSYKVNTGNIYSDAEAEFLSTVLRSKRMWLQIGSSRVEVLRNFKSLSISKTRRFLIDYDLNFDSAVK